MKMEQAQCSKTLAINTTRRGTTQKIARNI
jgi:hypothetical protein